MKVQPPAAQPPSIKRVRIWHRRMREPLLTLLLIVQIFILFVMPAVRAAGCMLPHAAVWGVLLIFVAIASVLSRSRIAIATMIVSVALTIAGSLWQREQPDISSDVLSDIGQMLTQISLLWLVSTAVFGRGRITSHRILGAVVMYLSIGMIFTTLYILCAQIMPSAFNHVATSKIELRETMTYFSFGVLTTGAFGDITPVHSVVRSLTNIEAICGQLFPATLLARIVGMHNAWKS